MKDTADRRLRWSPPSPSEADAVYPNDSDFREWAFISRHGPLPLPFLAMIGGRKNYANVQRRYTRFYHQGYLTRPPRQYESFHARYSPLVYDLAPKGKALIAGMACPMPPSRSAPFVHQLMQACATASLELAQGDAFIPRHELVEASSLAIELPSSKLIPDDVFALRLADGRKQFFLLEVDRNTESIERHTGKYNTWKKKVADYDALFDGALKRVWGIPKATVLVLTTNEMHADNIRAYVNANSRYADRWRYDVETTFGLNWRVPNEPLAFANRLTT